MTGSLSWGDSIILEYNGSLSNTGELIVMKDIDGKTILEVIYKNTWYPSTDGGGYSLVPSRLRKSNLNSLKVADDFMPSQLLWGSPGTDDFEKSDSIICTEKLDQSSNSEHSFMQKCWTEFNTLNTADGFST